MRSDIREIGIDGRRFQAEYPELKNGIRATVSVLDESGKVIASDRLNLDHAKARSIFASNAGVNADDLLQIRDALAERLASQHRDGREHQREWHTREMVSVNPDLAEVPRPLTELLEAVSTLIGTYVVLPAPHRTALALWVAHTHAFDAADATPYIAITSPEKRSGKTRLLETLDLVVSRPWLTGRTTAAALARKVDRHRPTLLLDESDAAFQGEREYSETLRGVLNTGHRRDGVVSVCVGKGADIDVRDFSTFAPKAIAGIGTLPDTVADRSIIIRLQRKAPGEQVTRFRRRDVEVVARAIQRELALWASEAVDVLRDARPDIPDELDDRAADGWEPLLAIADLAGGDWPEQARLAAVDLSTGVVREDESLGVKLLGDLRKLFKNGENDRLATAMIVASLNDDDAAPWGAFHNGGGIRPRDLANILKRYGVVPRGIRLKDGSTPRGYLWSDLETVCARYVPEISSEKRNIRNISLRMPKPTSLNPQHSDSLLRFKNGDYPHVDADVADVADKLPFSTGRER